MIGESIDHVLSWFAPAQAARRAYARRVYRRSYEGAKSDRTNSNWRPANQSADSELLNDANVIRARARDLVRNNAYARGVINALVRNVVGCGIVPQARIQTSEDKPIERLNDQAEALFERWAKVADASGRLTFWDIQRLCYREMLEAGECLVHFTTIDDDRSRPLSLALELIEADRLADDYLTMRRVSVANGNELRRGVEVDALGRAVAYWLYPGHPQDLTTGYVTPIRRPAAEFLHLYRQDRIGQSRGVSIFAPLVSWLKNLGYYMDNELQASAVSSCFTAAITTMAGPADGGLLAADESDSSDTDGNTFEYLQPGMVARLMPGESIETINPSRPNSQADAWINLMLRALSVGAGLSYERLARDYTKTNYSSARASDLEDRKEFKAEQEYLEYHLIGPVWQRFIEEAVLQQKLDIPAEELVAQYDRYTHHVYQPNGWEWVDPVKEATASQIALQSNLTTLADELGQRGRDLVDTLKQRKREKELLAEYGLQEQVQSPQPQQETEDAEQTEGAAAGQ